MAKYVHSTIIDTSSTVCTAVFDNPLKCTQHEVDRCFFIHVLYWSLYRDSMEMEQDV